MSSHLNGDRTVLVAFVLFLVTSCAPGQILFGIPERLPEPINVPGAYDAAISMTSDELEMHFTSQRSGKQTDLFAATRNSVSEPFGPPARIEELSTDFHDAFASLSSDGLEVYFHSNRPRPDGIQLLDTRDIWMAQRASRTSPFGPAVYLSTVSSDFDERSPSISTDRRELYFYGIRPGHTGWDIYVSTRATVNDPWGSPAILGPNINTESSEEYDPSLSADGLRMFYVSDRLGSRDGQSDLFVSSRKSSIDPWGPAINLGDGVNSSQIETHPFLTASGSELYFSRSPQAGTSPLFDNWRVKVIPFETVSLAGAGGVYAQTFNDLGTASEQIGTPLPTGWTATANDVVFQKATSLAFPGLRRNYAGFYNAGNPGDADRSLATGRTIATQRIPDERGELEFRAQIDGQSAVAMRLLFDVEAWGTTGTALTSAASPGEAAFDVMVEVDNGSGFQPLMTLGTVSTGTTLQPPAEQPGIVNGNDPAYRKAFDSGVLDIDDIPVGAKLRFRWAQPETAASAGWILGLDNLRLVFAQPGDADADGLFNSTDLVQVFQAGEFEDGVEGNSSWSDGDWNGDKDFGSDDLVAAFQAGNYERAQGAVAPVPEPTSGLLLAVVMVGVVSRRRFTLAPAARLRRTEFKN